MWGDRWSTRRGEKKKKERDDSKSTTLAPHYLASGLRNARSVSDINYLLLLLVLFPFFTDRLSELHDRR